MSSLAKEQLKLAGRILLPAKKLPQLSTASADSDAHQHETTQKRYSSQEAGTDFQILGEPEPK